METLVHWGKSGGDTFDYTYDKTAEYLANTREDVDNFDRDLRSGIVTDAFKQLFEERYALRAKALSLWGAEPLLLTMEARRMISVAAKLDHNGEMSLRQKVDCFLNQIGGIDHFSLVFQAMSCAGPLHDIDSAIMRTRGNITGCQS